MIVGYGRISSDDQDLSVQREKLAAAGCEQTFLETYTGTTMIGRVELERCLQFVRQGDVVVVTKMDRIARSVSDLCTIVGRIEAKGAGFKVLDQSSVDTTKPDGRLTMHILAAVAEFETVIRAQRQREGIDRAKANGVYKGKKRMIDPAEAVRLRKEGLGAPEIARRLKCGRDAVYRNTPGMWGPPPIPASPASPSAAFAVETEPTLTEGLSNGQPTERSEGPRKRGWLDLIRGNQAHEHP